ncbi:MAG TPA: exosortase/archaeosortase family protein [Nitrospirae bacterium]|nr:exosortase/archaeosortase family protein [Nitrospirota bacterium]
MNTQENSAFFDVLKRYKIQLIGLVLLLGGVYHSIFAEMVMDWYNDPDYSHGFLVPLISGYFVYQRRETLKKTLVSPYAPGLFVVILGILLLIIGYMGTELFTMRSSLLIVLAGIILNLFGKKIFRVLLLPGFYLVFMIPLPEIVYNAIAFPLKLFVAKYSVLFLQVINITVYREGNIIMFPNIVLEVADACSGIRSLMSLVALSVAISFFVKASNLKKTVIVLSAVPIAVFTNSLRVIITGILAKYWGVAAAEGFFHEVAGMLVFGLAMLMLFIVGIILSEKDTQE